MTDTISAGQAAEHIGTTGARLRVFLRASDGYQACGSDKRYTFTPDDLPTLTERFNAWATADDTRRAERKARVEADRAAKATEPAGDDVDLSDVTEDNPAAELFPLTVGLARGSKAVHVVAGGKLACGRTVPKSFVTSGGTSDAVTCSACTSSLAEDAA